jgi:hypothetical protein
LNEIGVELHRDRHRRGARMGSTGEHTRAYSYNFSNRRSVVPMSGPKRDYRRKKYHESDLKKKPAKSSSKPRRDSLLSIGFRGRNHR